MDSAFFPDNNSAIAWKCRKPAKFPLNLLSKELDNGSMKKFITVFAVLFVVLSFGTAQTGSNEIRDGVTDPGVPDETNESSGNQTQQQPQQQTNSQQNQTNSGCNQGASSQASGVAQYITGALCTAGQTVSNLAQSITGAASSLIP